MAVIYKTYEFKAATIERDLPESDVPCQTINCTLCCELLSPYLTESEFKSGKYVYTFLNSDDPTKPVIAVPKSKNGCFYLGEDKRCTIYNDRPLACRQFDCRQGHHPKINDMFGEVKS